MLFNSFEFLIFFSIVYLLYWKINHKQQNTLLLISSYIFYGWWDWRFLSLIWVSTLIDYVCGIKIHNSSTNQRKKLFLFLSIVGNLGILGFFKYFNFFSDNLVFALNKIGLSLSPITLKIILPVGISFYTFQTMSYSIDIYRKKVKPTKNIKDLALFVAFFPQLLAGPIELAKNLLPQIQRPRIFSYQNIKSGIKLILWGLFEKIAIADYLSQIVNPIFESHTTSTPTIIIGLYAFSIQIFCDFDGYSNIARGISKCLGFEIMKNFNFPYLAANAKEFWKRWHISLSSWLRKYLYIPLGGSRKGLLMTWRNVLITMSLAGLWHGAEWNFILWGIYQAILIFTYFIIGCFFAKIKILNSLSDLKFINIIKIFMWFNLWSLGWILFRSPDMQFSYQMARNLLSGISFHFDNWYMLTNFIYFSLPIILIHIYKYNDNYIRKYLSLNKLNIAISIFLIWHFSFSEIVFKSVRAASQNEFIYFQF